MPMLLLSPATEWLALPSPVEIPVWLGMEDMGCYQMIPEKEMIQELIMDPMKVVRKNLMMTKSFGVCDLFVL